MKQEDRFFSIAGVFALLVTASAFLWFNQEAILGIGRSATATQRPDAMVPVRAAAVPTPISPAAEYAARTAQVVRPAPAANPPVIIPAAYQGEVEAGAGQWATDTESIDRIFDTVASIAAGTEPELGGYPPPTPAEILVWRDRDDRLVVAPGTHRRYQRMVEAFDGLSTSAFAAAFDFFDARWSEGHPDGGDFRSALTTALDHLLKVEPPDVEPDMISKGTHWGFADTEYDRLSAAQKHLLLMGRSNARVVRSRLEEIRGLLGESEPHIQPAEDPFFDEELQIAEDEPDIEPMAATAPK